MTSLPSDPNILLSFINLKLRDYYDSLQALCDDLGIEPDDIIVPLRNTGYEYDPLNNRFG